MWFRRKRRKPRRAAGYAADPGVTSGELELRKHFSGRRKGRRVRHSVRVQLRAPRERITAETVDLSRSGALLTLEDPRFEQFLRLDKLGTLIEALGKTLEIVFGRGKVRRRIQVVRITMGGLGGACRPLLACRFDKPLTTEECNRLGMKIPARSRHLEIILIAE